MKDAKSNPSVGDAKSNSQLRGRYLDDYGVQYSPKDRFRERSEPELELKALELAPERLRRDEKG